MKDPSKALKNAYKAKLNNIVVGTKQVQFFKKRPPSSFKNYIMIGGMTVVDDQDKDTFQTVCTATIMCVTHYYGGHGDADKADDIANKVMELINTKAGSYLDLTADGFRILITTLDQSMDSIQTPVKGNKQSETEVTRILRFRHTIAES